MFVCNSATSLKAKSQQHVAQKRMRSLVSESFAYNDLVDSGCVLFLAREEYFLACVQNYHPRNTKFFVDNKFDRFRWNFRSMQRIILYIEYVRSYPSQSTKTYVRATKSTDIPGIRRTLPGAVKAQALRTNRPTRTLSMVQNEMATGT